VLDRLISDPRFHLVGVLVRDPARPRDPAPPTALTVTDPAALLAREPDVLIDALSDPSTGLALTRAALARGIHVVTANKQAVVEDLFPLARQAHRAGVSLRISACVGGGVPMIETVRAARAHAPIVALEAVLNGTVNFLLNRLAEGVDFDAAVAEAQGLGLAEADPSADLSGRDAAAKLAILAAEHTAAHVKGLQICAGDMSALTADTREVTRFLNGLREALATGAAVAHIGLVAFVGLAAPHLVRSLVRCTHAWRLLLSALMGGALLVLADVVARVLLAPQELPVGVLTAVLGGGYLLWRVYRDADTGVRS
jgi:homoserine dehydrogenase